MLAKHILIALAVTTIAFAISDIKPSQVTSSPLLLLYIYHPQCISCQLYFPDFEQLHQQTDKQYQIRKLNCANHYDFCHSLQKSYPAVYLFFEANSLLYEGEITSSLLQQWVQNLISLKLPTITKLEIAVKKRNESFLVIGGLNEHQKIQVSALKSSPYLTINFYQTQSKTPLLSLYAPSQQNKIDYTFPINARLLSYQIFHRTRNFVMSVDKQSYLKYYKDQRDSEQMLIFFDHHDYFSKTAKTLLNYFCQQFLLSVFCFKVKKQSSLYSELANSPTPSSNRSSIVYFTNNKQKGFIFPSQKIKQQEFRQFIKETREGKRTPDYDNTPKKAEKLKYSNALKLDAKNYKKTISNNQIVFIKYYSPYCKHCNILAPHYDFVAKHFQDQNSSLVVAALDCEQFTNIADQAEIKRYPTFKLFIKGQALQYQGERSSTGIIDFLNSLLSAEILTSSSLKQIKKPALVISGIDTVSNLRFLPAFYNSIPIYQLKNQQKLQVNIFWQDDRISKFTGKVTLNAVLKWLYIQGEPILLNLGSSTVSKKLSKAIKANTPILGLMDKGRHSVASVENVLKHFCKQRTDLVCGVARKGQDDYQHMIQWIGDKDQNVNRLVYINLKQMKSYNFRGDLQNLSQQKINQFIVDVRNGIVPQNKKSQQKTSEVDNAKDLTQPSHQETTSESTEEQVNEKQSNSQL